ncbi:NADPH-dependent FMN reductase [Mangrovactinospora gilvigrisea]|uniref:NADPH-dependent FMN reductase n=1 Tax=Mangrovactinospora gilvigrisea TaxID=1428644 RepID=A0A1J7BDA4_9ACTN|nr:NADPH-dependent FMN reductase [Mangrovactinospora gilvigrisea]
MRVAVLVGSVRAGRVGPAVADWFTALAAARPDLEVDVVDVAEATEHLPLDLSGFRGPYGLDPATAPEVTGRLAAADAFVVVTAEYNHSFPAGLKNLIDWHYTEWQAKPVGFVSYGGVGGGIRAVEALRVVFPELHAMTVRDAVSLHGPWNHLDDNGLPRELAVCESAAKNMLDQLTWWGHALRTARDTRPYGS